MSFRKSIVAVALLSVAASAHAGFVSAIAEPATVTLIFIAMAVIGFAVAGKRAKPVESTDA